MIENPAITLTCAFSFDRIKTGLIQIPTSAFLHRPNNLIQFSDSPTCTCIMHGNTLRHASMCKDVALPSNRMAAVSWGKFLSYPFSSLLLCLSMCLCLFPVSPRWQQVSEPAYGFILFDYISGTTEGPTDRQTDRQTEGGSQGELGKWEWMDDGGRWRRRRRRGRWVQSAVRACWLTEEEEESAFHILTVCLGLSEHFNSWTPPTTDRCWLTITNRCSDSLTLWSLSASVIM